MRSPRLSLVLAGGCAAALAALLATPRAVACSCAGLSMVPRRGETDVPRNVQVAVYTYPGSGDSLALREAASRELVEAEVAETELPDGWRLSTLTPATSLAAETDYEVVFVGDDATDVLGRFATGTTVDDEAPPAPAVDRFVVEVRSLDGLSGNSCIEGSSGYFGRLRFDLGSTPQGIAYSTVSVRPAGKAASLAPIMWSVDGPAVQLQTTTCEPDFPALVPGDTYCATLTFHDLAGNRVASDERCTTAVECAPVTDDYGDPTADCLPVGTSQPQQPAAHGCALGGQSRSLGASSVWLAVALAAFARRRSRKP